MTKLSLSQSNQERLIRGSGILTIVKQLFDAGVHKDRILEEVESSFAAVVRRKKIVFKDITPNKQ